MSVLVDEDVIDTPIEDGASRQQERVLLEEIEKDDLLGEIHAEIANSAQVISLSTKSSKVANLVDPIPSSLTEIDLEGNEEGLSVASVISLIEKGVNEEELEELLQKAISSIATNKSSAKKKMIQILELMTVLERTLRQSGKHPELQNALKQMQDKATNLIKGNNAEHAQQFLKSAELKATLQQGINQVAKQPIENFKNVADNVRTVSYTHLTLPTKA